MLTVHHLASSQSERIVWLCEELTLPYELVRYERDAITRLAPPAYKALHAFGTAPVITDGDFVLAANGSMVPSFMVDAVSVSDLAAGGRWPRLSRTALTRMMKKGLRTE
jgi:hypothetical protein